MKKIYAILEEDGMISAYSVNSFPDSVEIELDSEEHPALLSPMSYKYIDGQLIHSTDFILAEVRKVKEAELSKACQDSILDGFYHTIEGIKYKFSFDMESQLNFQGADRVLSQGIVNSIGWTVQESGVYKRVPVTKEIMNQLTMVILMHKDSNISKYREQLMPLVNSATTVEEIESITWDTFPRP